jgi:hypothetical protein
MAEINMLKQKTELQFKYKNGITVHLYSNVVDLPLQ